MPIRRAQQLRVDGQRLVAALIAAHGVACNAKERALIGDCLELARYELGRLDALLAGKSKIPENRVYLGLSSLSKGLAEIGGELQGNPEFLRLKKLVVDKAYDFFKETRPPIE